MLIIYAILFSVYINLLHFTFRPPYIYIISIFFLFDILPTIIVHVQYLKANWEAVLIINREHQTLTYTGPQGSLSYHFSDIAGLERVVSYGDGAWYSFSEYRYYRIIFLDGKQIVITSLMIPDIQFTLERNFGMVGKRKAKAVAFI